MDLTKLKHQLLGAEIVGLTIFGEARNQSLEGKVAVGSVIRNRVKQKEDFGEYTFKDVCLAKNQFSCWFERGKNYNELERAVDIVIKGSSSQDPVLHECIFIGKGIVEGAFRDNVNGATYYRTIQLMREKPIKSVWSMEIGDHVFYKLA